MNKNLAKNAFLGFCLFLNLQQAKASFNGKIALDSTWQKVAYLSLLPSFEDMHTLNKDFVVGKAALDKNGAFSFKTDFLPKHQALYRVHIVKQGDPMATLIMGGKQENHFFFVAGRNDNIQMLLESLDDPISTCKIVGLAVNNDIAQINEYKRAFYEINGENPALKAQLLNLAYQEQMQQIADSTQYVMAGLFALYNGNIYSSQNTHIYDSFLKKWQGNDSPYFKDFANKITPTKSTNYNFTWIIVALIIGLAIGIGFSIFWLKKRENLNPFESKSQLLNELSVQEKKVHRLLENGLSNKEISNELNIGVNTVKSHVSSILNKLKIKSRKEIMV